MEKKRSREYIKKNLKRLRRQRNFHNKWKKTRSAMSRGWQKVRHAFRWLRFLRVLRYLNPFHYIKKMDRYIMSKFIGTYLFSIALIISIAIVFDFNENLAKFSQYNAPWKAIVFDYYANFIPYFANLFSPLFVFIAVIFFTSKLAGNSEIIAILASGVSFKRLMRPYMLSCVLISVTSYMLAAYIIPNGTVVLQNFEALYKNNKKNTSADNVQLQVDKGVIAYMQHYDNISKRGYGFMLDKYEGKKLVSHLTAIEAQYDTIAESKYHWKVRSWKIRDMHGMRDKITSGSEIDTLIQMEPTDLVYSSGQQETFTSPQLRDYITKQMNRGSSNVVRYEVEYHKRIASSFASFILTIIGLSLSARKRKGGMGMYLGAGLALSFVYIMLQSVSASFAVNAGVSPVISAWLPNAIFAVIAYLCYRKAPN